MTKTLSISNGIAFVFTVVMNYVSNTGVFNGQTMKTISDKYFNYFTPAGYAFSIWGLIYLGLLGFVFYTGRGLFKKVADNSFLTKIGWWFVISCMANSLWVVLWQYEYIALSSLVMIVILFALVKIIINVGVGKVQFSIKEYLLVALPFSLYIGWISVALIANVATLLTKINWNGWGISEINWTIVMLAVAGLVNLFMVFYRNIPEFGLVGIWAVLAISVSNANNGGNLGIVNTCYIVAIVLVLAVFIQMFRKPQVKFKHNN